MVVTAPEVGRTRAEHGPETGHGPDAGRGARDAGRGTRDAGRGTRDAGRGTRDTGHGTRAGHGTPDTAEAEAAAEAGCVYKPGG